MAQNVSLRLHRLSRVTLMPLLWKRGVLMPLRARGKHSAVGISHHGTADGVSMLPKLPVRKKATKRKRKRTADGIPFLASSIITYVCQFGARPRKMSALGKKMEANFKALPKDLQDRLLGLPTLQEDTEAKAKRFMRAMSRMPEPTPKAISKWASWSSQVKCQMKLEKDSALEAALQIQIHPADGVPRLPRQCLLQSAAADGAQECGVDSNMQTCGALAGIPRAMPSCSGSAQVLYTPYIVVNWLYQATVDTIVTFQTLLGDALFDDKGNIPSSGGEIVLWWGTHLGSVRDQAMIAWDYDIDLAIFHAPHCNVDSLWRFASDKLRALGYVVAKHGSKYRICPADPLAWAPYKELYQETREANSLPRSELMRLVGKKWTSGERAKQPHGSNCVDVDMIEVNPGKKNVQIPGSTKIYSCPTKELFPTADGVFGPLKLRVPRTSYVLQKEYGKKCLQERRIKTLRSNASVSSQQFSMPTGWRHSVWPNKVIYRCSLGMWS